MSPGIRAEVNVDPAGTCPVVETSIAAGAPAHSVSKAVPAGDPERVTEEFTIESDDPVTGTDVELSSVFEYGAATVYRFTRERGRGCPCELVERFDAPLADVRARKGSLRLVFHAADMAELQGIMGALQEAFPTVDVQRLLRSEHERPGDDLLFVDRGELTDRQQEVLETAHGMGYFDHPKGANAGEVADELDISRSTFAEHISAAQSKLFDAVLDT
ncbi:helix-turn-helix domain-containing protein [Natronomonas marina]|jgi:predicted DNA binding protein|uniref:helix-turn-helix domain-containing protein n=1 Tax=Natronomonas marina TaxID=2961939 RepID=UPI0020CA0D24|nr:helix-turn-helix domain-containing protein [Natronomonas marina]